MVKPTNKSLSELYKQESTLENAVKKYKNSSRLVKAERITEQQIKAKGGNPNNSVSDVAARGAAAKRKLNKNG